MKILTLVVSSLTLGACATASFPMTEEEVQQRLAECRSGIMFSVACVDELEAEGVRRGYTHRAQEKRDDRNGAQIGPSHLKSEHGILMNANSENQQ